MSQVLLNVPNISCSHCERTIKGALAPIEGVRTVDIDIANRQVNVDFDESVVGLGRIEQVLADEDYPVAQESGDHCEADGNQQVSEDVRACCV